MLKNFFVLFVSVILLAGFTFAQQDNSGNMGNKTKGTKGTKSDTTHHMKSSNQNKNMGDMDKDKDRDNMKSGKKDSFVMKAASGGMMEVELGKYASTNASSQQVKDFGNMMVTDHSKANDELMGILKNQNMMAPDKMMSSEKKMVDRFTKVKGDKFDKEYMKQMVQDHKKDIKEFEKASKNEKNTEIKNWVDKTLPTLKKHLENAQSIEKNLK